MPYASYKLSNPFLSASEPCFIQGSGLILSDSMFLTSSHFTSTFKEVLLSLYRGILNYFDLSSRILVDIRGMF